ncbi:MAG: mevalonate kinase [Halobacteriovoraceae bacterium]|nr:mevalonate kinase [Halobacteriovoraceae bacterium]|tara:strand:+ start:107905 stop:108810 length:906 start_codon:yes stop_codon:yes gene_type:complete
MNSKSFSSKILLFGEYSVIQESNALLIPYGLFDGQLKFKAQNEGARDPELRAFGSYVKSLQKEGLLNFDFDLSTYEFDVGQGLFFNSTIPQGFGVGSSGALVASLYDRYVVEREKNTEDIEVLKRNFALLESHFHGSSSGFDPLVSYMNKPILRDRIQGIRSVEIPETSSKEEASFFLVNTGRSRKTEPLVNLFLEKCKSEEFSFLCESELTPITNQCIESFLGGDQKSLWESMFELSRFQFEHFRPMIPKLYHDLWEQGLQEKNFFLKLCGAGGGGFILGLCKDFKQCSEQLSSLEIRHL